MKADLDGIPQPGDVLADKYEIECVLGAGGMGVVLAARHMELGQRVAIKFLNAQFARHPAAVARFLREARAAAGIQSEHVARVHDVARSPDGAPYLVMEHLVGTDLEKVVKRQGPLPIDEAIDYVLQACEALAEAHAAGIVHRDLKPGNLFLTRRADGSPFVKVLDFGTSKLLAPEEAALDGSLTSAGEILGLPWYMSPEQVRSTKHVDCRTDIWSLGVVLHKLLTGSQAFESETLSSCLAKIAADPPTPLRIKRPDAPAELEAVILRCLEKDLDLRIQNVAELARALLPFAPPRSRLSAERAARVLGSDALTENTLPLARPAAAHAVEAPPAASPAPRAGAAPPPEPEERGQPAAPSTMLTSSVTPEIPAGVPGRTGRPLLVFGLVAGVTVAAAVAFMSLRAAPIPSTPSAAVTAANAATTANAANAATSANAANAATTANAANAATTATEAPPRPAASVEVAVSPSAEAAAPTAPASAPDAPPPSTAARERARTAPQARPSATAATTARPAARRDPSDIR